jgi:hypothetical protein
VTARQVPHTRPPGAAPLLGDLMPWSAAPLRIGRAWPLAPDAGSLRARWDRLLRTSDEHQREALFQPTRARGLRTAVPQLPGHPTPTTPLAGEDGPCPEPVRILHGTFDRQWLIPDHRLIDTARPELWRVTDDRQLYVMEQGRMSVPPPLAVSTSGAEDHGSGPVLAFSALEPNLAPGLLERLAERLALPLTAEDLLAWSAAAAVHRSDGIAVPLTASREVWQAGVALGRRMLWLHTHGTRCAPSAGERPKLPGGRRPYVRATVPADLHTLAGALAYDPEDQVLHLGAGRISPVPCAAWDFHASGVRVLEHWFEQRTASGTPGSLEAIRPAAWPQEWTSELLEVITLLALLAELRPERQRLAARVAGGPRITVGDLRRAGVLPAPAASRRPASVLDHREEGPNGQFALV